MRRVNLRAILSDPAQRRELIAGAVRFLCRMEGHKHEPPEQPYGPGAFCEDCGHFACRHDMEGCSFPREWRGGERSPTETFKDCHCEAMLWQGVRWPRPWLPAPDGLERP